MALLELAPTAPDENSSSVCPCVVDFFFVLLVSLVRLFLVTPASSPSPAAALGSNPKLAAPLILFLLGLSTGKHSSMVNELI